MFSSFLSGGILIYFFHVFQSSIVQRCHITSVAILAAWLGSLSNDARTTIFWKALGVWVIYSNLFFDMHTHWQDYPRLAKHILLCSLPILVSYDKMESKVYQLLFWLLVVVLPDMSSNIYGNAIMSEIKLFICCILIISRSRNRSVEQCINLEHYVWVFFIHDALVALAIWQMYYDFNYKRRVQRGIEKPVETVDDVEMPRRKRIITEQDLGNFFH